MTKLFDIWMEIQIDYLVLLRRDTLGILEDINPVQFSLQGILALQPTKIIVDEKIKQGSIYPCGRLLVRVSLD